MKKKTILDVMLTTFAFPLWLSSSMFLSPNAYAQTTAPSGTENNVEGSNTYLKLPSGAFRGSLPPGKTDPALIEATENANVAILQGEALLKSGHVTGAITAFQNALDYVPYDGQAYRRLAEAYTITGKLGIASQTFHKVLIEGFGPSISSGVGGSADIWAEYALVLMKTHQDAEATQAYNHSASLLDFEDSQYRGGKPFLKVLLPELVEYRVLPNQVRYTPETLQALANTILAHEELSFGSDKEALAHLREAVKLFPDSPVTHYYLGEALLMKDGAGAKSEFQKAVELGDDTTVAAAKERLKMIP